MSSAVLCFGLTVLCLGFSFGPQKAAAQEPDLGACFDLDPESGWSPSGNGPWILEKTWPRPESIIGVEIVLSPSSADLDPAHDIELELLDETGSSWASAETELREVRLPNGGILARWLIQPEHTVLGSRLVFQQDHRPVIKTCTVLPQRWDQAWTGTRPGFDPAIQLSTDNMPIQPLPPIRKGLSSIRASFRLPANPAGFELQWVTPPWQTAPTFQTVRLITEPPSNSASYISDTRLLDVQPEFPALGQYRERWQYPAPADNLDSMTLEYSGTDPEAGLPRIEKIFIPEMAEAGDTQPALPPVEPLPLPQIDYFVPSPGLHPLIDAANAAASASNWPFAAALLNEERFLPSSSHPLIPSPTQWFQSPNRLFPPLRAALIGRPATHRNSIVLPDAGCLIPSADPKSETLFLISILHGPLPQPAINQCRITRDHNQKTQVEYVFHLWEGAERAPSCNVSVMPIPWGGPSGAVLYQVNSSHPEAPWSVGICAILQPADPAIITPQALQEPTSTLMENDWRKFTLPGDTPIFVHGARAMPELCGRQWIFPLRHPGPISILVPLDRPRVRDANLQPPTAELLGRVLPDEARPRSIDIPFRWKSPGPEYLESAATSAWDSIEEQLENSLESAASSPGETASNAWFSPDCLGALHAMAIMGMPDQALVLLHRIWMDTPWMRNNEDPPLWALGAALGLAERCLELSRDPQTISFWEGFAELAADKILNQQPAPPAEAGLRERRGFNIVAEGGPETHAPWSASQSFLAVLTDLEAIRGLSSAGRILQNSRNSSILRSIQRSHAEWTRDLEEYLLDRYEATQSPPLLPLRKSPRIPGARPGLDYAPLAALCLESGFTNISPQPWDEIVYRFLEEDGRIWQGLIVSAEGFLTSESRGLGRYYKRKGLWSDLRRFLLALSAFSMDPGNHSFQGKPPLPADLASRRRQELAGARSALNTKQAERISDLSAAGLFLTTLRDLLVYEERTPDGECTGKLHIMQGAAAPWWNGMDIGPLQTAFGSISMRTEPDLIGTNPGRLLLTWTPLEGRAKATELGMIRLHAPRSGWVTGSTRIQGGMKGRSTDRWLEFQPIEETVIIDFQP